MGKRTGMDLWEQQTGVHFLKKIGIKPYHTVLDFGARVGHYTIPAAIAVGKQGKVYAIDKEAEPLKELERKAASLGLTNITTIKTDGELHFRFRNDFFGFVLVYDVLHYLEKEERKTLYKELRRIMKPDSLLSVYPKHSVEDFPLDEFAGMEAGDIKKEILSSGFFFQRRYCDVISHNNDLNQGCVLSFIKLEEK